MELKAIKDLVEIYGFHMSDFHVGIRDDDTHYLECTLKGFTEINYKKEWNSDIMTRSAGGIYEFKDYVNTLIALFLK